jgi:hypothetical protein
MSQNRDLGHPAFIRSLIRKIAAIPTQPTMVIPRVKGILRMGSPLSFAAIAWNTKNPATAKRIKKPDDEG